MKAALLSIAFALIAIMATSYGSQSSSLNASVQVECPFALNLGMHSVYVRLPNQTANFSVHTTVNCTIPAMNGTFAIFASNGSQVYALPLNGIPANQSPLVHKLEFNPSSIGAGIYSAKASFTYFHFSNSSAAQQFMLGNPTNITIENFSTSNTITRFSTQNFYISLKNTGSFAVPNSISIKILTTGPYNSSLKLPYNYSLSPSQYINITVAMYNSTIFPGTYNALLNVTYPINGTNGKFLKSAYKKISYTVVPPPPSPPKPVPKPISPIPAFSLMSFPFFESLFTGQSTSAIIDIKNNGNATEYVNFTVPGAYVRLMQLSATRVSIQSKQTIGVTALLAAPTSLPSGTYVVPINITAAIGNSTSQETVYTTISISNTTSVSVSPSISLANNTHDASATVEIYNPTGKNLTNVEAKTLLPLSVAKSLSYIKPYGAPYSLSEANGSYVITWYLSSLQSHSSAYAYFTVSNVTSQTLLTHLTTIFSVPSVAAPSSILKIIDISVPTFYVSTTNRISVTSFYTGTSMQQITAYISAPPGVVVYNSTQHINATPNTAFTMGFPVTPSTAGTVLLDLYISTQGANLSYSIPVLVLARSAAVTTATTTIPAKPLPSIAYASLIEYGAIAASVLVIAIAIIIAVRVRRRPRYDQERAEKLKQLRETMKRSE
ncbi:MAG: hypothetical protein M1360_04865 [Candidatus Marsarchaeota archaeon]|jgi:hypothetical protein|nr:hypothetical protein [Candidatus Marsarchaeota archaeon]MCL5419236.1 hypothetical protein [Candidatus Marsarchaeota archaeon]